jgi:hypothetical protein
VLARLDTATSILESNGTKTKEEARDTQSTWWASVVLRMVVMCSGPSLDVMELLIGRGAWRRMANWVCVGLGAMLVILKMLLRVWEVAAVVVVVMDAVELEWIVW